MGQSVDNCLLVDIGNQRLKWRLWSVAQPETDPLPADAGTENQPVWRARLSDEAVALDQGRVFRHPDWEPRFFDLPAPNRILVSAVCQRHVVEMFSDWCRRHWEVTPELLRSQWQFGDLANGYENPSQLGCDRWLAAIAAHRWACRQQNQAAVVVVDAGTAVTVDLVTHDRFVGGAIFPGIMAMTRVLARDTAQIRLCNASSTDTPKACARSGPPSAAATNSDDAVHAGAFHAVCGGVDSCIHSFRARESAIRFAPVLFTGGDAPRVASGTRYPGEVRSNLVLDGLALMAEQSGP